ncbi:hypothetical protein [Falsiroseomonas sp.]|uniref:hypothetical protein n=1 Tax=Falsiroseomonas sp. TaxID=2870721 RepID=UPI0035652858
MQAALEILLQTARKAGMPIRVTEWTGRVQHIATELAEADAEAIPPRRERRREIARHRERLVVAARRGRLPAKPLTISDDALSDLQIVDPTIEMADICTPADPAQAAARIAKALDHMDNDPDKPIYGFDAGGRRVDLPMRHAIAGMADVYREAGGTPDADENGGFQVMVNAVASAAGRKETGRLHLISSVLAQIEEDPEPPIRPRGARHRNSG